MSSGPRASFAAGWWMPRNPRWRARAYTSAVDVLTGIGWLDPTTLQRWKLGQLPSLAEGIQTKPARVAEAMEALRAWAMEKQLLPSETEYVARTPARPMLRFSPTGDVTIERFYRTHWLSQVHSRDLLMG
jgi:hypothetical protein